MTLVATSAFISEFVRWTWMQHEAPVEAHVICHVDVRLNEGHLNAPLSVKLSGQKQSDWKVVAPVHFSPRGHGNYLRNPIETSSRVKGKITEPFFFGSKLRSGHDCVLTGSRSESRSSSSSPPCCCPQSCPGTGILLWCSAGLSVEPPACRCCTRPRWCGWNLDNVFHTFVIRYWISSGKV